MLFRSIYISHRLEELTRIADYVSVLRDGKMQNSARMADVDVPWIIDQMVGKTTMPPQRSEKLTVIELDRDLVGLAPVKQRIRDIAALLVIDRLRLAHGLQAQQGQQQQAQHQIAPLPAQLAQIEQQLNALQNAHQQTQQQRDHIAKQLIALNQQKTETEKQLAVSQSTIRHHEQQQQRDEVFADQKRCECDRRHQHGRGADTGSAVGANRGRLVCFHGA